MSRMAEINDILAQVEAWPAEERATLAHRILGDTGANSLGNPPRRTLAAAVGLLRGPGDAPSDEDVTRWLDEHRAAKYGS